MRGDLIVTKGIYSLHIDWVGGLHGKVFDSRRCMTVRHDREQSIFRYFPVWPDWTQSMINLSYDQRVLKCLRSWLKLVFFIFILPFCNYYTSEEIKKELHIYTYDIAEDLAWGEETTGKPWDLCELQASHII